MSGRVENGQVTEGSMEVDDYTAAREGAVPPRMIAVPAAPSKTTE
jgi:hypothetical protein